MKKRIIIVAILAVILLTGCTLNKETKKETKEKVYITSLEGKYTLKEPSRKGTVYQGFEKYFTFDGNNVELTDEYDDSVYNGTYKIEDNKVVMTFTKYKDTNGSKDVTYQLSGNVDTGKVTITEEIKNDLISTYEEVYKIVK